MNYGGTFQVKPSEDKRIVNVEMSTEQLWRFIIGIQFLDGFVGKA